MRLRETHRDYDDDDDDDVDDYITTGGTPVAGRRRSAHSGARILGLGLGLGANKAIFSLLSSLSTLEPIC